MKNWKKTMSGTFTLIFLLFLYIPVFTNAIEVDENEVISDTDGIKEVYVNVDNRVEEIRDEEYEKLDLDEILLNDVGDKYVKKKEIIPAFEHIDYKFNFQSFSMDNQKGFTIKTSEMHSKKGIDYTVLIVENGEKIYESRFNEGKNLKIRLDRGSNYKVTILNQSVKPITYKINISLWQDE